MIEHAKWIIPAGGDRKTPCYFRANREIFFENVPELLEIQICCDTHYLLEVNGRFIGRGPVRCTSEAVFYDSWECAWAFRPGKNLVSALCLCMNSTAEAYQPITPAVRISVGDAAQSSENWDMYLCDKEFPVNGPPFTWQFGFAQWRDMNFDSSIVLPEKVDTLILPESSPLAAKKILPRDIPLPLERICLPSDIPAAAAVPECDLSSLEFARINTAEKRTSLPADLQKKLTALLTGDGGSVTLPVQPDNGGISLVFDFAGEISGRVEITLDAPAGTVADLVFEEELFKGDRLRADHTHTSPAYQLCDRTVLRAGKQTIGNILQERGFRMVQLTLRNFSSPVTVSRVRAVDVRYPFPPRGQFFCSDYQLNRLWDCAKETISACTTDVFTDCPWRERMFYCNDLFIENRAALKISGDTAVHKRAFRMVFAQHREDHLFTAISPSHAVNSPEDRTDFRVILSGGLTLTMALRGYFLHTGNVEFIRECLPPLRKMLERFKSWKDDDGIIHPPRKYWNFFDWSFELNGMGFTGKPTALLNFLYIISCRAMQELAAGAGEETVESPAELDRILKNSVKRFFDPVKKRFRNTTEECACPPEMLRELGVPPEYALTDTSCLVHALALLAGADENCCIAGLQDETLLKPELYYSVFLLDAFRAAGDDERALAYIREYWGRMVDSGTPVLWENGIHKIGKAGFGGSASLCHGFSSSPADFLQSAILGVLPLSPGFVKFRFSPMVSAVGFAQGSVPTPSGNIRISWRRQNDAVSAGIEIPAGCTAETPVGVLTAGKHRIEWHLC